MTGIDPAIARFLDGEPEPEDVETPASAMAGVPGFSRELASLPRLDDLLRRGAQPDDRAFVESLAMRRRHGADGDAFLRRFERPPRLEKLGVPRRGLGIAAVAPACVTLALLLAGRPPT